MFRLLQGKASFEFMISHGTVIFTGSLFVLLSVQFNLPLPSRLPQSHLEINFQFNMLYWHENGTKYQRSIEMEIYTSCVSLVVSALPSSLNVAGFLHLSHCRWPMKNSPNSRVLLPFNMLSDASNFHLLVS